VTGRALSVGEAAGHLASARIEVTPHQYFIWVGNPCQQRKNIPLLLQAFEAHHAAHSGHRLVLVVPAAKRPAILAMAPAKRLGAALLLLSGIESTLRDALYACAAALVFPSTCEGFGYPVVEAMVQGCPPIAAAAGPAAEIVGGAVPLCADFQVESFAALMRTHAGMSASQRTDLSERLRLRAGHFSVSRMAEATLKVFSAALGQ
jgi:glycosyltransferase involved in cell wall biosynthesis